MRGFRRGIDSLQNDRTMLPTTIDYTMQSIMIQIKAETRCVDLFTAVLEATPFVIRVDKRSV